MEVSHKAQGLYQGVQTRSGAPAGEFGATGPKGNQAVNIKPVA